MRARPRGRCSAAPSRTAKTCLFVSSSPYRWGVGPHAARSARGTAFLNSHWKRASRAARDPSDEMQEAHSPSRGRARVEPPGSSADADSRPRSPGPRFSLPMVRLSLLSGQPYPAPGVRRNPCPLVHPQQANPIPFPKSQSRAKLNDRHYPARTGFRNRPGAKRDSGVKRASCRSRTRVDHLASTARDGHRRQSLATEISLAVSSPVGARGVPHSDPTVIQLRGSENTERLPISVRRHGDHSIAARLQLR